MLTIFRVFTKKLLDQKKDEEGKLLEGEKCLRQAFIHFSPRGDLIMFKKTAKIALTLMDSLGLSEEGKVKLRGIKKEVITNPPITIGEDERNEAVIRFSFPLMIASNSVKSDQELMQCVKAFL